MILTHALFRSFYLTLLRMIVILNLIFGIPNIAMFPNLDICAVHNICFFIEAS